MVARKFDFARLASRAMRSPSRASAVALSSADQVSASCARDAQNSTPNRITTANGVSAVIRSPLDRALAVRSQATSDSTTRCGVIPIRKTTRE